MKPLFRTVGGWVRRHWLVAYLIALALSHLVQPFLPAEWYRLPAPPYQHADVDTIDVGRVRMAYLEWRPPSQQNRGLPPVILLHGCPGQATDFVRLAPLLAERGRRVISVDQLGFGESSHWVRDYSILADARATLALMDALGVERAHVVGWSNGGGTALHMADLAPRRCASITLLAAIGSQEMEGTGSYGFEHAKYAGLAVLAAGAELVPHFGLLGPTHFRHASVRFFWDSDQRPLDGIMRSLRTPTLILHGARDFLVPVRAAYRHHELIGPSTLVVLRASHFLPFLQARETGEHLSRFLARHDAPGVEPLRQETILAPRPHAILGAPAEWLDRVMVAAPWWLLLAIIAGAVCWRDRLSASIAAVLVSFVLVDFGLAVAGILVGLALRSTRAWLRGRRNGTPRIIGAGLDARTPDGWRTLIRSRPFTLGLRSSLVPGEQPAVFEAAAFTRATSLRLIAGAAAGWAVWCAGFFVPALLIASLLLHPLIPLMGWAGLVVGVWCVISLPRPIPLLLTATGRTRLRIAWHRRTRREYWSTLTQYLILSPVIARLALKHGLGTCMCCNPGIEGGGGMIGESKKSILDAFGGSPCILPAALIDAGPDPASRARRALDAIATCADLGGFPIILKPDAGQRGFALRLVRAARDVEEYFGTVTSPTLLQRFHPGPCECGILWARRPGESTGSIFSITRKEFPVLTGDGRRTLERLILRHPRFHCQAAVFLERFAEQRSRILGDGETMRLAQAGNHCQGTLFRDGADLITPRLERAIADVVRSFASPLDMCRLDLRYESDEMLREGGGFAIVELNGTAGESTNIYDPGKSIFWAYRVLADQWRLLYELGAERRREGAKPMPLADLLREIRAHYRERTGSAISD